VVLLDRDLVPHPDRSQYDLVLIDNRRAGYTVTAHLMAAVAPATKLDSVTPTVEAPQAVLTTHRAGSNSRKAWPVRKLIPEDLADEQRLRPSGRRLTADIVRQRVGFFRTRRSANDRPESAFQVLPERRVEFRWPQIENRVVGLVHTRNDESVGMCSSVRNLTLAMQRAELLGDLRRRALTKRLGKRLIVSEPAIDVVAMVEVIGERCVHVCEGQIVLGCRAAGPPDDPDDDAVCAPLARIPE